MRTHTETRCWHYLGQNRYRRTTGIPHWGSSLLCPRSIFESAVWLSRRSCQSENYQITKLLNYQISLCLCDSVVNCILPETNGPPHGTIG